MEVMTLSPEDNLIFLSLHLSKHDSGVLKLVADIAGLLAANARSLDWPYVMQTARRWGTQPMLYFALQRASSLQAAPVPAEVLDTLRPVWWVRWSVPVLLRQDYPLFSAGDTSVAYSLAHCLMTGEPRRALNAYSFYIRSAFGAHPPKASPRGGGNRMLPLATRIAMARGVAWTGVVTALAFFRWIRQQSVGFMFRESRMFRPHPAGTYGNTSVRVHPRNAVKG